MSKNILFSFLILLLGSSLVYGIIEGVGNYKIYKKNIELNTAFEEIKSKEKNILLNLENLKTAQDSLRQRFDELKQNKNLKIVYLTFDDGPTPNNTPAVLEILKKNDIKATFFVIGKNLEMYKDIVADGHQIAIHSYSHNYKEIYASEENFFKDFYKLRDSIRAKTGADPKVCRFPGGSSNTRLKNYLKKPIIERLIAEGYVYQDWNCDSGDASAVTPAVEKIVRSSIACNEREVNLLMHDSYAKTTTVKALQTIIDNYKSRGYIFEVLTVDSPKFQHKIKIKIQTST